MAKKTPALTLYVRDYCMYCNRVLRSAGELGVEVEVRNIWDDPAAEKELTAATGRATVPVLKIVSPDADPRWMPESADIVRYLQKENAA